MVILKSVTASVAASSSPACNTIGTAMVAVPTACLSLAGIDSNATKEVLLPVHINMGSPFDGQCTKMMCFTRTAVAYFDRILW
jgi:hypothetical protein